MSRMFFWENKYEDPLFPFVIFYIYKQCTLSDGQTFEGMLWHDELQFTLVLSGEVTFQVNGENYDLTTDDVLFINRAALHETIKMSDDCEYISLNFMDKLLSFSNDSRMEKCYVKPYLEANMFSAYKFTVNEKWQAEVIGLIKRIWDIYKRRSYAWEFDVCVDLVFVWRYMIKNIDIPEHKDGKNGQSQNERMRLMLTFIHQNYSDNLKLEDIAASANISVAECGRCFNEMIAVSPYAYLIRYRLKKAVHLLINSEYSVTDIAIAVGFQDVAHFIQSFKKQEGMTPGQFRKKYRSR